MKRFSLTKSCLVAPCVIASGAAAELATFNFELDAYPTEAKWEIYNASSVLIASSRPYYSSSTAIGRSLVVSSSLAPMGSSTYWGGYSSWEFTATLDLPAGDYTMVLLDSYGDGWTPGGVSFSGAAVGDSFGLPEGSQASGTFTVVPAPASLALLGLAGLTRRRRD